MMMPRAAGQVYHSHRFTTDFEPEPPDGAKAAEVARFIDEIVIPDGAWELSDTQQRSFFRRLCDDHRWYWPQVSRKLRQVRTGEASSLDEIGVVSFSERGIPIYEARFREPQPQCRVFIRYFNLGHFVDMGIEPPCNSPACKECGPGVADALLGDISRTIYHLPKVYVAQTTWDKNLAPRMGQRRAVTGMNTFTYHCVDDSVTIVADKPIKGRSEPKTSAEMSGADAFAWLRDDVLWVPGSVSATWSDGWDPKTKDPIPQNVSLEGLSDDQVDQFKRMAAAKVRELYGVEPGPGCIPAEARLEFRLYLIRLREAMKHGS